jgi:hypothetical protein
MAGELFQLRPLVLSAADSASARMAGAAELVAK